MTRNYTHTRKKRIEWPEGLIPIEGMPTLKDILPQFPDGRRLASRFTKENGLPKLLSAVPIQIPRQAINDGMSFDTSGEILSWADGSSAVLSYGGNPLGELVPVVGGDECFRKEYNKEYFLNGKIRGKKVSLTASVYYNREYTKGDKPQIYRSDDSPLWFVAPPRAKS